MIHSFDTEIAQKYGVHSAIILNNIYFWTEKNRANGVHIHDGRAWTYNSKRAFSEMFPYLSARQIDYALTKLKCEGVIITGNFNEQKYDQTLWYAITDFGYSILQNCEMESTKLRNGFHEIVQPIPDSKPDNKTTDSKPDNKTTLSSTFKKDVETIVSYLNKRTNSEYKPSSKTTQKLIRARMNEGFTVDDFRTVIDNKVAEWGKPPRSGEKDMRKYLRPETLFGTKFESYLNEKKVVSNDGRQEHEWVGGHYI